MHDVHTLTGSCFCLAFGIGIAKSAFKKLVYRYVLEVDATLCKTTQRSTTM